MVGANTLIAPVGAVDDSQVGQSEPKPKCFQLHEDFCCSLFRI